MNKKFKLTDKVTKESIRSPEFKRWLMRTLAVVCIISLIFQFSTCVYHGLNAYAVDDDSIVGTWVFNESISSGVGSYNLEFTYLSSTGVVRNCSGINSSYGADFFTIEYFRDDTLRYYEAYNSSTGWQSVSARTIIITFFDLSQQNSDTFITWLQANAVKQAPPIVHDFTNEIRVFNDELTFFITNSTTWTEAFNFNFDVIGVGTADYIVLQRDVNNNYTMSYSYDFEGSGGLRTVYRFNHTTDTGGFFKQNTKYIRFISNPENTDFQQWLLDNTTLVGTSDDAASFDTFFDMGFNVGYNSGYEQGFANSLIGDSLSGPINALSSITLIQIGDTVITLGGVIMTAIALCLVLAFLKLYAGG